MSASSNWTVPDMLDLAHRHVQAEADGDLEAVMATMAPDPAYTFYPTGIHFSGLANVRRYYAHVCANLPACVVSARVVNEWGDESSVAQETDIAVRIDGGEYRTRVASVLEGKGGRVVAERIYATEAFLKLLLGEMFDAFRPA